ncbi:MAG: acyl CoA:acetate/3-ketoacid CoA transferase [Rhodospirillales bacterium]|nr:acyl CoA:acetate/3-ketoacid CoA transferase [Rhodospirillales bacterium]
MEDAAAMICDGDTVAISAAGGGLLEPEAFCAAIEARFLETGHPRDLTLVNGLGFGNSAHTMGINHFAHKGLIARVIVGLWSWSPKMQQMVEDEEIEAYCLPGGVISLLLREIGAGRPGLFTHVGLETFADPRLSGRRCNARTTEDIVELMTIDGREVLRYKPMKIDVGIVRGTFADPKGNISMRHEPADLDAHAVALAAHNCGGTVIAQVSKCAGLNTLPPRDIRIPGVMVDALVVDPDQRQTHRAVFEPELSGQARTDNPQAMTNAAVQPGIRQVIARRAAEELMPGSVVNFGFGIPGGIPNMMMDAGKLDDYWLTIEQGSHNGAVIDGELFGAAVNPEAIVSSIKQFDFYSGGGIDIAFLGMGEMDRHGNVNVSHLNGRLVGTGGFIDISQNAKKVVFCGTFETKGLRTQLGDGGLEIIEGGSVRKLVSDVAHLTFSAERARKSGQAVVYVTERAVFRMTADGVELTEIAPGVDLKSDILDRMDFTPMVNSPLTMNPAHFRG